MTFSRVRAMTGERSRRRFPNVSSAMLARRQSVGDGSRARGSRWRIAIPERSRHRRGARADRARLAARPARRRGSGKEPSKEVSRDALDQRTSLKLVVRVAAGAPGKNSGGRGAASAVAIDSPSSSSSPGTHEDRSARSAWSVFWSDASIGTNLSDDGALFRFASAAATGAVTDAEAAFRFGGVGVGRNARDAWR